VFIHQRYDLNFDVLLNTDNAIHAADCDTQHVSVRFATVNINIDHDHDHHYMLDNNGGSDDNSVMATATATAATMATGARDASVSRAPGMYLFFANVLTYAQGVARHNAGNRLQAHMRRLRRQPF
jgi:hypothetical protein